MLNVKNGKLFLLREDCSLNSVQVKMLKNVKKGKRREMKRFKRVDNVQKVDRVDIAQKI